MSDNHTPPPLSTLSEAEGALALARYHLLQPFLEQGVPLAQVAKHHGLVLRTVQRWVARYQAHGLVGLARRARADRGLARSLRPELKHAIEGLALRKPAPSAAFVHRQVVDIATQHGWPLPSYQCVYKVIRRLDPALVTLAHAGSKAYRTTFDLLYRREAGKPNEIW
jgi:putative transposase